VVGIVLVATPALLYAGDDAAGVLDRWLAIPHSEGPHVSAALQVDAIGEPTGRLLLVAAAAALCAVTGRIRLALVALLGTALTSVVATVLKPLVGRTIHGEFLSFPSGHTAAVVAIGLVLGLLAADLLRLGPTAGLVTAFVIAALAGAVMAWAQLVLDAHYLTDAVGGAGCAAAVVPPTAALVDRVAQAISGRGVS
jgi:membrane-associated phospholipid phosphatase